MKTKIVAWLAIASALTAGTLLTYADTTTTNSWTTSDTQKAQWPQGGWDHERGGKWGEKWMRGWMMTQLTDAEKTKLQSMTDAEKQAFFEAKRTETEAKMEAREAVMDKLVAGEALTTDSEKAIQKEIIAERAAQKTARAEMKAKQATEQKSREEIKSIIEKKAAGTALTTDETTKLVDYFTSKADKMDERGWDRGGQMGEKPTDAPADSTTTTSTAQ